MPRRILSALAFVTRCGECIIHRTRAKLATPKPTSTPIARYHRLRISRLRPVPPVNPGVLSSLPVRETTENEPPADRSGNLAHEPRQSTRRYRPPSHGARAMKIRKTAGIDLGTTNSVIALLDATDSALITGQDE